MSYRFVVVDLNAMWNSDTERSLRPTDRLVVPHEIAGDILKSSQSNKHARLFEKFLARHQRRICVAHRNGALEQLERGTGAPVAELAWVDWNATRLIRRLDLTRPLAWESLRECGIMEGEGRSRDSFLEFASVISRTLNERHPGIVEGLRPGMAQAKEGIHEPFWGGLVAPVYRDITESCGLTG
jgi:hypothetical protein